MSALKIANSNKMSKRPVVLGADNKVDAFFSFEETVVNRGRAVRTDFAAAEAQEKLDGNPADQSKNICVTHLLSSDSPIEILSDEFFMPIKQWQIPVLRNDLAKKQRMF